MNVSTNATGPRIKLLIPGLLLVLLLVLLWPSRKNAPPPAARERPRATDNSPENPTLLTSIVKEGIPTLPTSPLFTLSDAIAINPFEMPAAVVASPPPVPVVEPSVEPLAETPDEEPSPPPAPTELQAIFYDQYGAAAIIEDRVLRIGDRLKDGRTILRITRQGVELVQ